MASDPPKKVKDPHGVHIVRTFHQALQMLDATEAQIRDMIESELMDVAGISGTKVKGAMLMADELAKKISALRVPAIKQAFRHLRDNLPSDL